MGSNRRKHSRNSRARATTRPENSRAAESISIFAWPADLKPVDECPPDLLLFLDNRVGFLAAIRRFCQVANDAELDRVQQFVRERRGKLHPPESFVRAWAKKLKAISTRKREIESIPEVKGYFDKLRRLGNGKKLRTMRELGEQRRHFVESAHKRIPELSELAEVEREIQWLSDKLPTIKKRGRPRAEDKMQRSPDDALLQWAIWRGRNDHNWTWPQATVVSGLEPTRANIRNVQRRQAQFERLFVPLTRHGNPLATGSTLKA